MAQTGLSLSKPSIVEIVLPKAQDYAENYTSDSDGLLSKISSYTLENHPKSQMLSGKTQGRLLSMLSRLVQPYRILEIGTFTGFSALCLAEGLAKGGQLHTIELREDDAATAKSYFKLSVWNEQIILHLGNALEIIPGLDEVWDLVFIDADKVSYLDYYKLVLPKVRKGGLIIADNVLFHGEVLSVPVTGKNAVAIQAFNEYVAADDSVETVMLTVRDGLMLIRKK